MKYSIKKYNIISSILLVLSLGVKEIVYSFYLMKSSKAYMSFNYLFIECISYFLLGICLIFVTKGLFKRLRSAWFIAIFIISLILIMNLLEKLYFNLSTIILIYIVLSLLIQKNWFKAKLNPLNLKPINSYEDKLKVQALLMKFATNPVSAIILENDKQYFFSKDEEGVIGYTVINNIALVAGEPICSNSNIPNILSEFKKFCLNNSLSICFCQISSKYRNAFEESGFILQEYGKEAIIQLDTYTINGSKAAKIRWANNKMDKLGIKVMEYKPLIRRDENIENQIHNISNEWLKMKKSSELSFMLGTVSLKNPFDRRYFIATNPEGIILAFIVCFPYKTMKGYFVDITRRGQDAPLGIMEKLIIDTCKILKNEEVQEVSLGLAPLADIAYDNNIQSIFLYKTFKFIYENMNSFYGFKALYEYKKKYNPSVWETSFIAFSSEVFIPSIGYAIVKAKHPQGIRRLVFDRLKSLSKKKI